MKRGESKHSPRRILGIESQEKALLYRKMGLTYSQVADKLGTCSRQTAWAAVHTAIKRSCREPTEAMRKLELERLDELPLAIYDNACQGNVQAISRVLGIMDRRARLLGLLAPLLRDPGLSSA
jgi:transcriptional regulator